MLYILALYLARYAGLRIHECFRIDTATTEKALRENMITVKGKGGKIRSVPIPDHIRPILETLLDRTERGHKLLVPDDKPTDRAIKELQGFLRRERAMIQDPGDDRPLTFHGLRHSYASDTYMNLLGDGMEDTFFSGVKGDAAENSAADAKKEQILDLLKESPELADLILAIAGGAKSRLN